MSGKDDNLRKRLLATFQVEAQEHVQTISAGLVGLEKAATQEERTALLDATFRAAHSLKGAARAVSSSHVETLCQSLEGIFAAMKRHEVAASAELFDVLHRSVAALSETLQAGGAGEHGRTPRIGPLVELLRAAAESSSAPPLAPVAASPEGRPVAPALPASGLFETVRVATGKLDAVLLQAEELLASKLGARQHAARVQRIRSQPAEWKKRWAKAHADLRAIRRSMQGTASSAGRLAAETGLARVLEFLDWNQRFVTDLDAQIQALAREADHHQRSVGTLVDALLDEMKNMVTQPFSTLLDVLPGFVREVSREQGKAVALDIRGGEIEIDRRILERLKDPLIHLIRNCLDHGIEPPAERHRRGKPPQGSITIEISAKDGANVEMRVADDGAGIDTQKVKAAAIDLDLVPPERAATLSDEEARLAIFQPGLSTAAIVTDISGRGLGLAIVKEQVEGLNGAIALETTPGGGTTFRMTLPVTFARFRGIVVRACEQQFVLPAGSVTRVVRVREQDIKTVENRATVALDGAAIALVHLGDALSLPTSAPGTAPPRAMPALVLGANGRQIAFLVDEVIDEQEVLVKPLGRQLARVPNIAGATILGSGRVAPVLNAADLMISAVHAVSMDRSATPPADGARIPERKSVLVAEDSITSRDLLKNILLAAGYEVQTAVDGMDALAKLRDGEFALVVSDVDMPRMNGFDLTARIRAERKFAELPVVLVTALDSREDRERGIDVGADAYLVKSSFDQGNLLETVRRLI